MSTKQKTESKTMYEYIRDFLEEMNEKFPEGDDSIVVIMASDGRKISSLYGGDSSIMQSMISYAALTDDEFKDVMLNAISDVCKLMVCGNHVATA